MTKANSSDIWYIFDIDSTLANCDHRLKHIYPEPGERKDWGAFFEGETRDSPITETIRIAEALDSSGLARIIFLTGRPESSRERTEGWLSAHTNIHGNYIYHELYMRPSGDRRPDWIVKKEIYETALRDKNIAGVFEDRRSVVHMWRELGLRCFHVEEGDY